MKRTTQMLRSAIVMPFPQRQRVHFIKKTVARLANSSPGAAENMLAAILTKQTEVMARKGISPQLIERERRALVSAIRSALWHEVLTPDDGAA